MDHLTFAQLLGNYGEFLAAVAVVVTLIYVAMQVNQAKELMRENAHSGRFQADLNLLLAQFKTDSYYSALGKICDKDGPMFAYTDKLAEAYGCSYEEGLNMAYYCFAWLKFQEHSFLSNLSIADKQMHDEQIRGWFGYSHFRQFWDDQTKLFLDHRFTSHVDDLIHEARAESLD